MFENLSIGHLLVVLVIFLLLFGAKRIPEIAGSLGQGINEFKKTMSGNEPSSTPSALPPRETVPLGAGAARSATGTAAAVTDEVQREPKRLM